MEIKRGHIYHIKDEYFDIVKDSTLMKNHEKRHDKTYINNDLKIMLEELKVDT